MLVAKQHIQIITTAKAVSAGRVCTSIEQLFVNVLY
jgi:hypothetical protein